MLKFKYKRAVTTEDRLWEYAAEQAKQIFELATNEKLSHQSKKARAELYYFSLREAFKSLGVVK